MTLGLLLWILMIFMQDSPSSVSSWLLFLVEHDYELSLNNKITLCLFILQLVCTTISQQCCCHTANCNTLTSWTVASQPQACCCSSWGISSSKDALLQEYLWAEESRQPGCPPSRLESPSLIKSSNMSCCIYCLSMTGVWGGAA